MTSKEWLIAIERVKSLFFKGKQPLFAFLEEKSKFQSHKSNFLKFPRLVEGSAILKRGQSLLKPSMNKSFTSSKKEKNSLIVEWAAKHGKEPSLESNRVKDWEFKERKFAKKRLSEIESNTENRSSKKHRVTFINGVSKSNPDKEKYDQWEAFIRVKEERHFHLGRVIKYLSE